MWSRRRFIQFTGLAGAATIIDGESPVWAQAQPLQSFELARPGVTNGQPMRVFLHRPHGATVSSPVVMVMHGNGRNAEGYLREWVPLLDAANAVGVAPHFDRGLFARSLDYNQGGIFTKAGKVKPRGTWSFDVIEQAFDAYRKRFSSSQSNYLLYGHSAGGQFVHRFLLTMPQARVAKAVTANAGSYTMPDPAVAYPYGLSGLPTDVADEAHWLRLPLTIMLGDQDIDPEHPELDRSPGALAEGPHRLARGEAFVTAGERRARALQIALGWSKIIVPGVAHNNRQMAKAAASVLLA